VLQQRYHARRAAQFSANRDHNGIDIGRIVDNLQANRALSGDDERVSERMNIRRTILIRDLQREALCVVEHIALKHDARAPPLELIDFDGRHIARMRRHTRSSAYSRPTGYCVRCSTMNRQRLTTPPARTPEWLFLGCPAPA